MNKNMVRRLVEERASGIVKQIEDTPWQEKGVYADFLAQVYYYVCHTTRLLAAAGARFPLDRQDLHHACFRHAAEEKSHEMLSASDMKALGYGVEQFPELPGTKALYRSAYYLIERVDPISLIGYAYFLEFLAVEGGGALLRIVEPLYGAKAVRHVHVHAKEDPEHVKAVEAMLERISEKEMSLVTEAVETAAYGFSRILEEVKARKGRVTTRAAA